jgi:hypothetical protein
VRGAGFDLDTGGVAGDQITRHQCIARSIGEPDTAEAEIGANTRAGFVGADVVVLSGIEVGVNEMDAPAGIAADEIPRRRIGAANKVVRAIGDQNAGE